MKFSATITVLAASAMIALPDSAALAQRQQPTPEQRIDRLERQVGEMQRRVYPKGRPADTAGFPDDPAATQSSVMSLDQRLDALQKQLADMLRQTEENGNRLRNLEAGLGQLKADEDQRIQTLEQRMNEAAAAAAAQAAAAPAETTTAPPKSTTTPTKPATTTPKPATKPKPKTSTPPKTAEATLQPAALGDAPAGAASDPGEDAYNEGFHEWEAGQYDQAIGTLKAFVASYPKHRRVSYANNLIGRAQLDKGDAEAAVATLLSNYRQNPGGDRAQDSLLYLGQALFKLGQTNQACNAYSELDAVYGAKIRPDVKKLESDAKAQANCG